MSERISAMDVRNQSFTRKVRGYDSEEVDMFLTSIADEIERLNLRNAEQQEELGHVRQRIEDYRTRERTLQETLVTAQRMADELKDKTETESQLLVKEARLKAERLLEKAQDQLAAIEAESSRAKLERDMFENRLRSVIEEHLAMIDLRKKERSELDNVRFLQRRAGSEAG